MSISDHVALLLNFVMLGVAVIALQVSVNAYEDAHAALTAADNQFRLEQRAWVGPVGVVQPELKETNAFSISTVIGNSGKTPALKFENKYSWTIMLNTGVFNPTYANTQGVPSSGTIFPNGQLMLISVPVPLTKQYLDLVTSGQAVLYVYGELTYNDVFNRTHHTHFCSFYDKSLKPGVCNTYNDVD
jgi:hypothetical protein